MINLSNNIYILLARMDLLIFAQYERKDQIRNNELRNFVSSYSAS